MDNSLFAYRPLVSHRSHKTRQGRQKRATPLATTTTSTTSMARASRSERPAVQADDPKQSAPSRRRPLLSLSLSLSSSKNQLKNFRTRVPTRHGHEHGHQTDRRPVVRSLLRWPLVHCCLPLFTLTNLLILSITLISSAPTSFVQSEGLLQAAASTSRQQQVSPPPSPQAATLIRQQQPNRWQATNQVVAHIGTTLGNNQHERPRHEAPTTPPGGQSAAKVARVARRAGSGPMMPPLALTMMLPMPMPMGPLNELRQGGSKSEPPSRPSVDWSKQRPYFGAATEMQRNVSVELGKTAYLTCKVHELGDKTVSWLRPRENEILTAGRYTYIGDPRFSSINWPGSPDWILEIKEVTLNDSTNYECQVSTDPKMSTIIGLQVKAAKSRIRQGEQYFASAGSQVEFACEILPLASGPVLPASQLAADQQQQQQTYWYHNGNLINYNSRSPERNFSIIDASSPLADQQQQLTSRLRLSNVQASDSGNYTCKPTSAEPATIRLHVKRPSRTRDRVHYSGGGAASSSMANTKGDRTRHNYGQPEQHQAQNSIGFGLDSTTNELLAASSSPPTGHLRRPPVLQLVVALLVQLMVTIMATTANCLWTAGYGER